MSGNELRATVAPSMALVVLWSSGFIGAELGTRQAPASTLLAWRYLVATGILIALCAWRHERVGRAGVRRQIVLGLLCQATYLGLTVSGVGLGVPSGTAALIAALQPLVVIALAALVLAERARLAQLLGLALGLAGVVLGVSGDLTAGSQPGLGDPSDEAIAAVRDLVVEHPLGDPTRPQRAAVVQIHHQLAPGAR